MIKEIQIPILPSDLFDEKRLRTIVRQSSGVDKGEEFDFRILKRSIDARKKPVKYQLRIEVRTGDDRSIEYPKFPEYQNVKGAEHTVGIIGSGPAGLFAALKALEYGIKPIIFERGKDVRTRRKDLANINKEGKVNPESNYCFGEGGAGTYSDGKLYTRSKKRGSVKAVLQRLIEHGADPDIAVDAHPHIGTNKLPKLIESIREKIIECGGEVRFDSRVTDILVEDDKVKGVFVNFLDFEKLDHVILATGHSARDIYTMLNEKKIEIEFKSFALGVRVEHQQQLIDSIQYKCESRGDFLPPAAYSLVHTIGDRGVYSFCMCPGGIIAPCATSEGEVVTNGWSPSKRNNPYSNSGIVTEVRWDDIPDFHQYGPLAGMKFQESVERKCFKVAGGSQKVPAQRLKDFVDGIESTSLPKTSYHPGIVSRNLKGVLPPFIYNSLKRGFVEFGKKMKGYMTNDAVVHATESRTSSPVRIPRDNDSFEHPNVEGLYPCGEGAGYAGGIISAAIDGERCVEKLAQKVGLLSVG